MTAATSDRRSQHLTEAAPSETSPVLLPVFHGRISSFLPVLSALREALVTRFPAACPPAPNFLIDFVPQGESERVACVCFRRSEKKLKCNKSLQKLCRSPTPHTPHIPTHNKVGGDGHRAKSVLGI